MDTQVESQLPGLHWSDSGYAAIEGELLIWAEKLDQVFKGWATDLGATAHRFPTLIAAESLEPISYLKSFPHLATFASCGTRDDEALRALAADEGGVNPKSLDAPQQILTPAACYHFYHRLAGSEIPATARSRSTTGTGKTPIVPCDVTLPPKRVLIATSTGNSAPGELLISAILTSRLSMPRFADGLTLSSISPMAMRLMSILSSDTAQLIASDASSTTSTSSAGSSEDDW